MKQYVIIILSLLILGSTACEDSSVTYRYFNIGMISGEGGFEDNGYNAACKLGLEKAAEAYRVNTYFKDAYGQDDISDVIDGLVESGAELIFVLGYEYGDQVLSAADKYPNVIFSILDYVNDNVPDNVVVLVLSLGKRPYW